MKKLYQFPSQFTLTCFAVSVLSSPALYAQSVNESSFPQYDPGQVERRFENRSRYVPDVTRGGGADVRSLESQIGQQQAPSNDNINFVLRNVALSGVTVYNQGDLSNIYADKVGSKISISDVYKIAQDITRRYRTDGYVLSRAVVVPQRIRGGVVNIRVIEGYVNDVRFDGKIEGDKDVLLNYAEKIKANRPLNSKQMERYLLLMDDLPGVTAKAVLQPSNNATGASQMVVRISHDMSDGYFTYDNRGTKYLGEHQFGAAGYMNSFFGNYERTGVRGQFTSDVTELQYFEVSQEYLLDNEGTTIKGEIAYTNSEPGHTLEQFDIEGKGLTTRLTVEHPYIRSRSENLFARAGITTRDIDNDILGTTLYNDRLRMLWIGGSYDFIDDYDGINFVDAQLTQGLDLFGATDGGDFRSRGNGEASFTKINIDASRNQMIGGGFAMLFAASMQYSLNPLLASEEFALGGARYGRAYDPSELTGDHGFAFKTELQYNDIIGHRFFRGYQLYGFYDFGTVWEEDAPSGVDDQKSLASTGLGVRFNVVDGLSGGLELALPLTKEVEIEEPDGDGDDPRLFMNMAVRF